MPRPASRTTGSSSLHEWVHDARHLLGFPCH
ncbi:CbtB domain-containing protein [Streptomyces seoulensis]